MDILLDTHITLWYLNGDERLPREARQIIDDELNTVYFSTASMWEITIKHALKPSAMKTSGKEFYNLCMDAGFYELTVNHNHVLALPTLHRSDAAPPHKDPFDRIMLSQAKSESLRFLTHDTLIPYYNEPCILKV